MRRLFVVISAVVLALIAGTALVWRPALWSLAIVAPLVALGTMDMLQRRHAVRRNFPLIGHGRYLFEMIRPEINQDFVESNSDGKPFSRNDRSVVYQRAKGELDTLPFGTQRDVYAPGLRVDQSLALNAGAKMGGFAHNTGEGGLSPYHLEPGGDLVWQIGTGYFSCRSPDEGGTGAAPMEFSDSVGTPLNEGLSFVHNALVGANLRHQLRVIASGKVNTGFQIATKTALGAEVCNAARPDRF